MNTQDTTSTAVELFGEGRNAIEPKYAGSAKVVEHYVPERVKRGKKSVIVKDKAGNTVWKKDAAGNPVVRSTSIVVLQRKNKAGDDLATLTGLTGAALLNHQAVAKEQLHVASLSRIAELGAKGKHTYGKYTEFSDGGFSYRAKPIHARPTMSQDDLIKLALEQYGLTLVPSDTAKAPKGKAPKGKK